MIPGVLPDPNNHCIRISFHVPPGWGKGGKDISPLRSIFEDGLQRELDMIKDILVLGGITTYLHVRIEEKQVSVFSSEDEIELANVVDNIQIMQYPNASRLISGILECISQYCEGVEEEPEATYRQVQDYLKHKLSVDLHKRNSHLGAKRVLKDFLIETQKLEGSSPEDKIKCIRKIQDEVNNLAHQRGSVLQKIAQVAVEANLFQRDDRILVFGYSSTILEILKHLADKGPKAIYVAECRNKTIYTKFSNKMTYNDGILLAEEISKLGYAMIYFVSDASVAHYLRKKEITKILFGANGIKGGLGDLHSVGHLMIAELASAYGVPVYVAADTLKVEVEGVSSYIDLDAERETFWSTEDIAYRDRMNKASIYEKRPRLDVVPFEKITGFITEKGFVKSREELFGLCTDKQ